MNRKALVIILFITFVVAGCINEENHSTDRETYHWIFLYDVRLTISDINDSNNYTIYLPIPLLESADKQSIPKFIQPINITYGNISIDIIETAKGKALNISGFGDFHIHNYYKTIKTDYINVENSKFNNLSLTTNNSTNNLQNFYLNTSSKSSFLLSIDVYMKYETSRGVNNIEWELINYNLENGWSCKDIYSYDKSVEY